MLSQTPPSSLLQSLLEEPLLLEVGIVGAGLVLLLFLILWVRRVARDGRRRRGVASFVQGIDRFVRHDHAGAVDDLERVLEADPANVEARVALGECYRELDRAAEAERLHTEAIQVFQDDRPGTRLALARDLLALGRPDRALPWLEEVQGVLARDPLYLETGAAVLEELGRFRQAAERLRELLLVLQGPGEEDRRAALRRRIGTLLAREGERLEGQGDLEQALVAYREAISWNPTLTPARTGVIRTLAALGLDPEARQALEGNLDELERLAGDPDFLMLPGAGGGAGAALPVTGGSGRAALPGPQTPALAGSGKELPAVDPDRAGMVMQLMEKEALFHCRECAAPLVTSPEECPACGALGAIAPLRSTFTTELTGIEEILDEIEENPAHIARLVAALYDGDEQAAAGLLAIGLSVLPVLHTELLAREEKGPLLAVLVRFGVAALPPLLEVHRSCKRERSSLLGGLLHAFGDKPRLLAEVAAAFGPRAEAEPFFLGLVDSTDPEERRAVLDYFVATGRPASFDQLQVFARVEVINHLSRLPVERLLPLLMNLEEGHGLIDWVLVDPTLQIEEALLAAFARVHERGVLAGILRRRGFHPSVERSLHAFLCHSTAGETARGVLASYGEEALPHRIPVLLDPETTEEARAILADLVVAEGGKAVREILVRCLGVNPSPLDEAALGIVARIGPQALPELKGIYEEERGLLAKFPLVRKRSQRRRELVLRAVGRIEGGRTLLAELVGREQEGALRRLGEELLRRGGEG